MNEYDIKRLALMHAILAEIEGMKAQNLIDQMNDLSNNERIFHFKAKELRDLANTHNEDL